MTEEIFKGDEKEWNKMCPDCQIEFDYISCYYDAAIQDKADFEIFHTDVYTHWCPKCGNITSSMRVPIPGKEEREYIVEIFRPGYKTEREEK